MAHKLDFSKGKEAKQFHDKAKAAKFAKDNELKGWSTIPLETTNKA